MLKKPSTGVIGHLFQRAGFFKQMRGLGNDDQFFLAGKQGEGLLIHLDHGEIIAAHNQKGGGCNARQERFSKVRAPPARNHSSDRARLAGGGLQGGSGSGAGAKVADEELTGRRLDRQPMGGGKEPIREEIDVEDLASVIGLGFVEEINKERRELTSLQNSRHESVPRAEPSATAPVSEQHQTRCLLRNCQITLQLDPVSGHDDRF